MFRYVKVWESSTSRIRGKQNVVFLREKALVELLFILKCVCMTDAVLLSPASFLPGNSRMGVAACIRGGGKNLSCGGTRSPSNAFFFLHIASVWV